MPKRGAPRDGFTACFGGMKLRRAKRKTNLGMCLLQSLRHYGSMNIRRYIPQLLRRENGGERRHIAASTRDGLGDGAYLQFADSEIGTAVAALAIDAVASETSGFEALLACHQIRIAVGHINNRKRGVAATGAATGGSVPSSANNHRLSPWAESASTLPAA